PTAHNAAFTSVFGSAAAADGLAASGCVSAGAAGAGLVAAAGNAFSNSVSCAVTLGFLLQPVRTKIPTNATVQQTRKPKEGVKLLQVMPVSTTNSSRART